MKLNLPNKLTVARIIATPIFMLLLLWEFKGHYIAALLLFIAAALTDMFDGNYARKYNMVTDFGKFLDPLADKMLTTTAFLGFIALGIGNGVVIISFIVLFREFLISSLRLTAVSSGGTVIAANIWGKLKTITQMVAIITAMIFEYFKYLDNTYFHLFYNPANSASPLHIVLDIIVDLLLWGSAILAVVSGVIYLIENKKYIDTSK